MEYDFVNKVTKIDRDSSDDIHSTKTVTLY